MSDVVKKIFSLTGVV